MKRIYRIKEKYMRMFLCEENEVYSVIFEVEFPELKGVREETRCLFETRITPEELVFLEPYCEKSKEENEKGG